MRVKFLDQAKTDLREIGQHYQEIGGNTLVRKMLVRIKHPVLSLGEHPNVAPPYELAPGVRRLVVADGAFLVFYRIQSDVEILHIRRAERAPVATVDLGHNG
jgi:plasmid stabilization system protein ParE